MAIAKEILKVASLAHLDLTEDECVKFASELEKIAAYFAQLQGLGLQGQMIQPYRCPLSPDSPRQYDINVEDFTKHLKEGYFLIPPWLA